MHFVMVNITFRVQSAPGVERVTEEEKKFGDFSIMDDPDGSYSTLTLQYPNLQFDRLSGLGYFNTLLNEGAIKDAMAECVKKRRA
ncbi:Cytosolic phospholipase A2 [Desmophyllum pertusum]|uniref:Cytosolic phospholipase A2 n=1 Tax=Desmophyllum pertusum TaxID=174260 RepID=A0A9X0CIT5_9CNID|nr:Cytosolic phospholipase A2 [Desmophyllum pertusum]